MTTTGSPEPEMIRRSVDAILASETFSRSERLRSFLAYVVDNQLAGKGHQLKGYSIGVDVFSRSTAFDAGTDPIVRVQAGKLRKLLERYYQSEGLDEPLRVCIPVGGYVPQYSWIETAGADQEGVKAPPDETPDRTVGTRKRERAKRHWLPAPVSSHLALFSLLPMILLAPSAYPDAATIGIANAKLVISSNRQAEPKGHVLPEVRILQCWPAGNECRPFAQAIAKSAGYYHTIRLMTGKETGPPGPLSYSIRIENEARGLAIYARLIHDLSGETVHAAHFRRTELRDEATALYEAVSFSARTLSASGRIYQHALRQGTASDTMKCMEKTTRLKTPGEPRHAAQSGGCLLEWSRSDIGTGSLARAIYEEIALGR